MPEEGSGPLRLAAPRVEALAENHQIALDAVQHGHARQRPPCVEAETPEEAQARLIVAEDEAEHGVDCRAPGAAASEAASNCLPRPLPRARSSR